MKQQEENIKKALEELTPEWNDNLVWDSIENELHPKRKKRFFFWFLLGFILIGSSYGTYLAWDSNAKEIGPKQELRKNEEKASENSSPLSTEKNQIQSNQEDNKNNTTEALKTPSENLVAVENVKTKQNNQLKTSKKSNNSNRTPLTELANQLRTNSITAKTSSPSLIEPTNSLTSTNSKSPSHAFQQPLDPISTKYPSLLAKFARLTIPPPALDESARQITPVDVQQDKKYSLVLQAGLYQTHRRLATTTNPTWLSSKNQMDKQLESIDFSLSIRRNLNNNFFATAGIGLSQTVEMMTVVDSLISINSIASDSATIVTNDFQTQYLSGDLQQTTTQKRTTKTPNKYQALYLPISIGYQLQKGKWGLQLSSGIDIELSRRYKGKILAFDDSVVPYQAKDQDYFDYTVGIANLNFGTAINYEFSDRICLTLGAAYKYGLFDYLISEDYTMRYNKLGLSVSSIYQF